MSKNFKYDRLAHDIQHKINQIINDDIDDLDFVTVLEVELTKDLQDAKVYVNCLLDNQEEYVLKTLQKREKFIKRAEMEEEEEMKKNIEKKRKRSLLTFPYNYYPCHFLSFPEAVYPSEEREQKKLKSRDGARGKENEEKKNKETKLKEVNNQRSQN